MRCDSEALREIRARHGAPAYIGQRVRLHSQPYEYEITGGINELLLVRQVLDSNAVDFTVEANYGITYLMSAGEISFDWSGQFSAEAVVVV